MLLGTIPVLREAPRFLRPAMATRLTVALTDPEQPLGPGALVRGITSHLDPEQAEPHAHIRELDAALRRTRDDVAHGYTCRDCGQDQSQIRGEVCLTCNPDDAQLDSADQAAIDRLLQAHLPVSGREQEVHSVPLCEAS